MKYEKEKLTLEEGIKKEWIITNGIGGYSSSTIIGANTRKYHGLLVAATTPPGGRKVILSKVDESIETNGKQYNLYTNMCKEYISDGYKNLIGFDKEYVPIFTYKVENILIKKFICMEHGKNTVTIFYAIKNQDKYSKLTLAPVVNYRDFHAVSKSNNFNVNQEIVGNKVKININNQKPIYINVTEGRYKKHDNDIFRDMYYIEEEKRGQEPIENHVVPGRYEIKLRANEEKYVTFVCSLEEDIEQIDAKDIINKEIMRLSNIIYDTELLNKNKEPKYVHMAKNLIEAADNFVVYRPSFALSTLIAGYPWFLDWSRDTLISFEGLLLKLKRFDIAKEVLLTIVKDIKNGLVPNGYSEYKNKPLYNSADASLLLFEQVKKYLNYTNEYEWVKENIYPSLEKIMDAYKTRIDLDGNNIYMDSDYLIVSGTKNTQNTWMDAKIGEYAVTPRNGKAVEINSMWYNALKIMEELTILFKDKKESKTYSELAKNVQKSFIEKFYNKRRKALYDVIRDSKIRPNQLSSLSLSYPVIDPNSNIADEILETTYKKLVTPYGLRTLAKGEPGYRDTYEGDMIKRDMSYHQGTIWPWLLGIYYDALTNKIKAEKSKTKKKELEQKLEELKKQTMETFSKEMLENATVGSISELYDYRNKKYNAQGAFAQAWSVAEIIRIIL